MEQRSQSLQYSIGIHGVAIPEVGSLASASPECAISNVTQEGDQLSISADLHAQGKITYRPNTPSFARTVIIGEERSTSFIEVESEHTHCFVNEISLVLRDRARMTIIVSPKGSGETYISLRADLAIDTELTIIQVLSQGSIVKYEEEIKLSGDRSGVHVVSIMSPRNDTVLDMATHVEHVGNETRGHVRALGFLRGVSKTTYRATGAIANGVIDPRSSEDARFLVIDKGAEVAAIPSLDIASDRVATSHKLAIYQLGDKDLYYAMSRGLSEADARSMLYEGLLDAELSCIKSERLVEEIKHMVHQ